jgi:integrase
VAGGDPVSALIERAGEYLAIRRAFGFKLDRQGQLLLQFVDYADGLGLHHVTTAAAVAWARQPVDRSPAWWKTRLSVVRGFAGYLHLLDPAHEVPPSDVLAARNVRAQPFLFAEEEIVALMAAARALRPGLRAATYETLVGLLATAGLRVGEAIRLTNADMDWAAGILVVRNTKFGRSREVPLEASTLSALHRYTQQRDRLCPSPDGHTFFLSAAGRPLNLRMTDWTFQRLLALARIDHAGHHRPPRPHDLRHTFIVRTLQRWHAQDLDVEALLPRLSTYVGHSKPADTYWYYSDSRVIPMPAPSRAWWACDLG